MLGALGLIASTKVPSSAPPPRVLAPGSSTTCRHDLNERIVKCDFKTVFHEWSDATERRTNSVLSFHNYIVHM